MNATLLPNRGLTSEEASSRLREAGNGNRIRRDHIWPRILVRQLRSPFIYLLLGASVLAFFLGEKFDAALIVLFILINTALGFYQEYKSERTLQLLGQFTKGKAKAIRDGREVIVDSDTLVPGDAVLLETGDLVPADIRITSGSGLRINETVLTGESIAVSKMPDPSDTGMAYEGTTVIGGSASGIVTATGNATQFGKIRKLAAETEKESAFSRGISRVSDFILKLTVITLLAVFGANLAIKGDTTNTMELIVFSIALAVSVIPEALPVVTTLSLTRGVMRLVRHKVIVKRLSAIEDLGSIEILATDKTGTITENELRIESMLERTGSSRLLSYAHLAGNYFHSGLEPFDKAIADKVTESGIHDRYGEISHTSFDPVNRYNGVTVKTPSDATIVILRGAPEALIPLSPSLTPDERKMFTDFLGTEGAKGHRVLAVVSKEIAGNDEHGEGTRMRDMVFEGCISFADPVKKSAFEAVEKAEKLGIRIVIITGDNPDVSRNVAKQIGLHHDPDHVIDAADFLNLPERKRMELMPHISVFARTNPEQKHGIIRQLQSKYQVGFLGEGINDAPALKAAGVSLVVQSASDIAREAADIILLKKDLRVIVDGIGEGRRIFANTVKYLKATLASNFGNFYAVAIGSLFIDFLPMLPVQLLLVNLLSDFPMIAVAADSVDSDEVSRPVKYDIRDIVLVATVLGIVSTVFDFMFFGFFYRMEPAVLQTNWFMGSVLTELAFLFSVRTRLPFFRATRPPMAVIGLTVAAAAATIILPYTQTGMSVFRFQSPTAPHLALIMGLVGVYFFCSETVKYVFYRTLGNPIPHKK